MNKLLFFKVKNKQLMKLIVVMLIPNANNGTTQNQQVPTQGIWDAIDAEIAPLTQEQQNMLLSNHDYAKLFEEWFVVI